MKKIHMLCNAHLDPVWLWSRDEGMAEAISTFRVAADFCERYDDFIFNHNEAVLYEYVELNEPELFERIKRLVKLGKWRIMGGWYLQPDCLMPSAEGLLRQIERGNRYFLDKFGIKPTTAINFDSFGHTRGLVQILKKCGYDSYLFMRPNGIIPENDFIWKGYEGSEVLGHALSGGYNTAKGKALERLHGAIAFGSEGSNLMLWGIGNHGGGPSEIDLNMLEEFRKTHTEDEIIHSYCEQYFAERRELPVLRTEERSMVHIFVGCSTSMSRIKQNYRALENELIACEKMLATANIDAKDKLSEATRALLFCQFHDILPGTMIKKGEEESLRLLSYGREILSSLTARAFFRLCQGQKAAKSGEIPVMVFNPHPYPVTETVEVEFQLEDQNWNDNEMTLARVRDENGNYLPAQTEKEGSSLNMDWRKRVAFTATLSPLSLNRFDCELYKINAPARPIAKAEEDDTHFTVSNPDMQLKINKNTGLIDKYEVSGKDLLRPGSAGIDVLDDFEDPWLIAGQQHFGEKKGEFKLLSADEANAFKGHKGTLHKNVTVIENGDARCKIQATFKNRNSFAVVTYIIPKTGRHIDMNIKLWANDVNSMYKLSFNTAFEDPFFEGHTAYGREPLRKQGLEASFQKWCALSENGKSFAVINKGNYGGSAQKNIMSISLMRTPVCSAHPVAARPLVEDDRMNDRIDLGEHEYELRLSPESELLDFEAELFNQPPYALSFFPSGSGEKRNTEISLDSKEIILSCFRKEEDGYFLRLFNSSDSKKEFTLKVFDKAFSLTLGGYEAKAYRLKSDKLTACKMLSGVEM